MDNNKILIIGLIVIIGILLVGIFAIVPNLLKEDTILNFNSASTLKEGDTLAVVLVDDNGNPIAGEKVNITVTDSNGSSDYHSVLTDASGNGKLKLDKGPGDYKISISYGGNDKYKASTASKKIKIEEEQQEATVSQTPSAYAYQSDGTPMYSQSEVDNYMLNKYGMVNYHVGSNGYIDMDEPGFDDAGHYVGY